MVDLLGKCGIMVSLLRRIKISGYLGDSSSAAAEIADDMVSNELHALRKDTYSGPSLSHCMECGDPIPEARRAAVKCKLCISCQEYFDKLPKQRTKMLDKIL